MPEIKFSRVLSCNSEDEKYPAENLLRSYKKWKCKKGEKKAVIILQLEKACKIQSIDIGNESSAFIEVLGGKSSMSDDDYTVHIPTAGFMTPDESRKGINLNGVRFFDEQSLTKEGRGQKWDRIKIICMQPFNQDLAFGLSFVKIHAPASEEETGQDSGRTIGKFKFKDDVDEHGISKKAERDFAPGALFSAMRKAALEKGDVSEDDPSTSTKVNNTPHRQSEKRKAAPAKVDKNTKKSKNSANEMKPTKEKAPTKETKERQDKTNSAKDPDRPSSQTQTPTVEIGTLLKGVVFVLSGFQNPVRSQLRDQAVEMGARYRPDWNDGCTHLVCAFANTPKYEQVKGKGIIVKKEWITESYKRKTKLDWKKYAFERIGDNSDDDQDEVTAADVSKKSNSSTSNSSSSVKGSGASQSRKSSSKDSGKRKSDDFDPYNASTDYSGSASSECNTDDEIERVRRRSNKKTKTTDVAVKENHPRSRSDNTKEPPNDLDELPDFLSDYHFFFYGGFPNDERKRMQRYIVSLGGTVEQYMDRKVTHVITQEQWDTSFDEALQEFSKIVFIRPDFVIDCGRSMRMTDIAKYKVKKP